MTKSYILSIFIVLLGLCATSCSRDSFVLGKSSPLSDYVQTIPVGNVMHDSLWNIWCASMVEGYDGKFHLYYSRWPRKTHHESWISHSEIAYAVADKPEGPYKFQSVALERCDSDRWDGTMTHNPYIIKHKGKYYLYYIGTFGHKRSTEQILKPYGNKKMTDSPRRYPTLWGSGHDWVPDHHWGGSRMIGVQEMLMQCVGDNIYILPVWPSSRNVTFRLHALGSTVVTCTYKDGKIYKLRVSPEKRKNDIVLPAFL